MKSTKKRFLSSVLALLLCFCMLLGTTFAWFTDSVTSGKNRIVAGNLDVELWHTSKSVTEPKQIENGSENLLFTDVDLWEPGVFVYETFTVKNVGNLALKYSMGINVVDYSSYNGHDLTEVLKVKVVDSVPELPRDYSGGTPLKEWRLNANDKELYPVGNELGKNSEDTFTVVIYWEPGSNDYDNLFNMNNGRPQELYVDLGVNLVATQLTAENDSFNDQYDKDAVNELIFPDAIETVMADVEVEENGSATITVNNAPATAPDKNTSVEFEAGALGAEDSYKLNVTTYDLDASNKANFVASDVNGAVAAIDLTLTKNGEPTTVFNGKNAKITTTIAKNLTNFKLSYVKDGIVEENFVEKDSVAEVTNVKEFFYNPTDGTLVFCTNHFSNYVFFADSVAYIPETDSAYDTLLNAVDVVTANQKVMLLKDCNGCGIQIENKTVSIDFCGFTYTVDSAPTGSTGTKNQCFQLLKGSTVSLENGTIVGNNADVKLLIQNYANLTLNNMVLDATKGSNIVTYVMSNNYGTANIVGNTSIIAKEGGYAVDAYYWPKGGYDEGVTVNINTTGTIKGNIELAADAAYKNYNNTVNINSGKFIGNIIADKGNVNVNGGTFGGALVLIGDAENCNISIAANTIRTIEAGTYKSLLKAIEIVPVGGTVKMNADISVIDPAIVLKKDMTFDLGGKTLSITRTATGGKSIYVESGKASMRNGSVIAQLPTASNGAIYVAGSANLTVDSLNVSGKYGETPAWAIALYAHYMDNPNGDLVINSGTFNGLVGTNGSTRGGSFTVNGGTFNDGLYLPAWSDYTINGGTFNAQVDIYSAKSLTINGGTFNAGTTEAPVFDEENGPSNCAICLMAFNGQVEKEGYGPTPNLVFGSNFAANGKINGAIGLARDKATYDYPIITNAPAGVQVTELGLS